jgi:hypothetical protein
MKKETKVNAVASCYKTVYKGFKLVKKTDSLLDAKQTNEGDGIYNVIGKDYRDSYQILKGVVYA